MYLNRLRQHNLPQRHHNLIRARILYHLKWNVLPVVAMLVLLGWASLQAGEMIDESKQSTDRPVGLVE